MALVPQASQATEREGEGVARAPGGAAAAAAGGSPPLLLTATGRGACIPTPGSSPGRPWSAGK